LSENQCGMETYGMGMCVNTVHQLSENQCGMETVLADVRQTRIYLVEREPMWDGNIVPWPSF